MKKKIFREKDQLVDKNFKVKPIESDLVKAVEELKKSLKQFSMEYIKIK